MDANALNHSAWTEYRYGQQCRMGAIQGRDYCQLINQRLLYNGTTRQLEREWFAKAVNLMSIAPAIRTLLQHLRRKNMA